MNNSIKKQSIVQSGPWGLEEFVAPLNKMPVKIATGDNNGIHITRIRGYL